jgi:hypothetical protein
MFESILFNIKFQIAKRVPVVQHTSSFFKKKNVYIKINIIYFFIFHSATTTIPTTAIIIIIIIIFGLVSYFTIYFLLTKVYMFLTCFSHTYEKGKTRFSSDKSRKYVM